MELNTSIIVIGIGLTVEETVAENHAPAKFHPVYTNILVQEFHRCPRVCGGIVDFHYSPNDPTRCANRYHFVRFLDICDFPSSCTHTGLHDAHGIGVLY